MGLFCLPDQGLSPAYRCPLSVATECCRQRPLSGPGAVAWLSQFHPSPHRGPGALSEAHPRAEVRARFFTCIRHKATAGWCRKWAGSSWFHPSGHRRTILAWLLCGPGPGQHTEGPQQNAPLPEPALVCFPLTSRADAERLLSWIQGALSWGMQRCLGLEGLCVIWKGTEWFSNYFHMRGPHSSAHLNLLLLPGLGSSEPGAAFAVPRPACPWPVQPSSALLAPGWGSE